MQRKNRSDLQARDDVFVDSEVHTDLNVRAPRRDPTALLNALGRVGQAANQKALEQQAEKTDEAYQRGIRDETIGVIDPELEANSRAYGDGRSFMRTRSEGIQWGARASQELTAALIDNPNLDYNEWKQAKLQEFLGTKAADPVSVKAANSIAASFIQNLDNQYAAANARIQLADAQDAYQEMVLTYAQNGALKDSKQVGTLLQMADDMVGVDRDMAVQYTLEALLPEINNGNIEAADGLREFLTDDIRGTNALNAAVEQGTRANEARHAKEIRDRNEKATGVYGDAYRAVYGGILTQQHMERMVQDEYWSAEEGVRYMEQSKREAERRIADYRKQAAEAEDRNKLLALIESGYGNFDGANGKDARKVMDEVFTDRFVALETAGADSDPAVLADAVAGVNWAMSMYQRNGMFPQAWKNRLNSADPSVPSRFTKIAEGYRNMQQSETGAFIKANVDNETLVKYDIYNAYRDEGMSPTEVAEVMASNPKVDAAEAVRQVNQVSAKKMSRALESYGNSPVVRAEVEELAALYVQAGRSPDDAIQTAVEKMEDRFTQMDGIWVRTEGLSTQNPTRSKRDYVRHVLIPEMNEQFPNDYDPDTIEARPNPLVPGQFVFYRDGLFPILRKDGTPWAVTEAEMRTRTVARLQNQNRAGLQPVTESQALDTPIDRGMTPGLR